MLTSTMLAPDRLDVRCPRCGGRAAWEEPFAFESAKGAAPDGEHLHRWGGWLVREKFPSVIRWKTPRRGAGHPLRTMGVVRCGACHRVARHRLRWPADAYWQWRIRGETLWAWTEEHARVLLDYIGSGIRDPHRHPGYARSLQRLPAVFLAARNRDRVTAAIARTLA